MSKSSAQYQINQYKNDIDLFELIQRETQFWCQKLGVTPPDLFRASEHELQNKLIDVRKREFLEDRQQAEFIRGVRLVCENFLKSKPWRASGGCDSDEEVFLRILRKFAGEISQTFEASKLKSVIERSSDMDFDEDCSEGSEAEDDFMCSNVLNSTFNAGAGSCAPNGTFNAGPCGNATFDGGANGTFNAGPGACGATFNGGGNGTFNAGPGACGATFNGGGNGTFNAGPGACGATFNGGANGTYNAGPCANGTFDAGAGPCGANATFDGGPNATFDAPNECSLSMNNPFYTSNYDIKMSWADVETSNVAQVETSQCDKPFIPNPFMCSTPQRERHKTDYGFNERTKCGSKQFVDPMNDTVLDPFNDASRDYCPNFQQEAEEDYEVDQWLMNKWKKGQGQNKPPSPCKSNAASGASRPGSCGPNATFNKSSRSGNASACPGNGTFNASSSSAKRTFNGSGGGGSCGPNASANRTQCGAGGGMGSPCDLIANTTPPSFYNSPCDLVANTTPPSFYNSPYDQVRNTSTPPYFNSPCGTPVTSRGQSRRSGCPGSGGRGSNASMRSGPNRSGCGGGAQVNCERPLSVPTKQYIEHCLDKPSCRPPTGDIIFRAPPDGCLPCWGNDSANRDCACSCPPDTPKMCPRVKGVEYEETFLKPEQPPPPPE